MKFKVGDEVVVSNYRGPHYEVKNGMVGIVTEKETLPALSQFPYKVQFENCIEVFFEDEIRSNTKLDKILK